MAAVNILTAKLLTQALVDATKPMFYNKKTNLDGYITLISVTIIGAVATAIVLYLLLSGTNASKNSLTTIYSAQARALANACAEEALQQIRDNTNFTGTNSIVFSNGTCTYAVTNSGGDVRTIFASSSVSNTIRKVRISTTALSPKINISSWQEVGD